MPADRAAAGQSSHFLVRADLLAMSKRLEVPPEVVEKDYILSYLLAGIADIPDLRGLLFKGGTALKKIHFGDYRFSEDLDFSAVDVPRSIALDAPMTAAVRSARERLEERGRFNLVIDRPPECQTHPAGQDAFRVLVAFPWHNSPMVRVKIEVTHDEPVLLPATRLPVRHGFDELDEQMDDVHVSTYAIEEIVVEKLRALLQTQQRLQARGWSRPRPRDYYDLWRILSDRVDQVDVEAVRRILPQKFAHRGVRYASVDDFFTPQLADEARRQWRANLGTMIASLPEVERVLTDLHSLIATLLDG